MVLSQRWLLNSVLHSCAIGSAINTAEALIFAGLIDQYSITLTMSYYKCDNKPANIITTTNVGAFNLSLDFINLFQFLLALMGGAGNAPDKSKR